MLIDNVNLNHIRIFESVYRSRSMTRAAEELHITQSGVSQHIKHLEEILRVTLFDRVKQRLLPTQQADHFYQSCKDGLYTIEKALTHLKGIAPRLQGSISFGVAPHFFSKKICSFITKFLRENPQTKIKIRTAAPSELWQMVQNGEIDFSLIDCSFFPGNGKQKYVTKSKFVIVGSHQLIQKFNISLIDKKNIVEIPFIDMVHDEGHLKKLLQFYLKTPGLKPQVVAEVPDWSTMIDLCVSGVGLAVMPEDLFSSLDSSTLAVIPITSNRTAGQNSFEISYAISHLVERSLPFAAQEFMGQIIQIDHEAQPHQSEKFIERLPAINPQ